MAQAEMIKPASDKFRPPMEHREVIAAGLFGYSIADGKPQSFAPMAGYIRELEQMPNFSPPSIERFVTQYIRNNIDS